MRLSPVAFSLLFEIKLKNNKKTLFNILAHLYIISFSLDVVRSRR